MTTSFCRQRLRRLSVKLIILLAVLAGAYLGYRLVLRFWHILDAYVYTLEFHLMFQVNNLAAANLPRYAEYFRDMGLGGQLFFMATLALLIQNFWLPWSRPLIAPALMAAFGLATGSAVSFIIYALTGWLCFGLGLFFLGDLLPLLLGESWWRQRWQNAGWIKTAFLAGLAIPFVPLSVLGLLAGLARLPGRTYSGLLVVGMLARTALLLAVYLLWWRLAAP